MSPLVQEITRFPSATVVFIPLLLGLFATIPHHLPAASYKSIIVNQSDGSEMKVTIEDDMKTTVAEGNLVISCTKGDIVLPVIDKKTGHSLQVQAATTCGPE